MGAVAIAARARCNAGMTILPLRLCALAACLTLLAACQSVPPRNPLATWEPSPNFDARRAQVIVLHYTEQD